MVAPDAAGGGDSPAGGISYAAMAKGDKQAQVLTSSKDLKPDIDAQQEGQEAENEANTSHSRQGSTSSGISYAGAVKGGDPVPAEPVSYAEAAKKKESPKDEVDQAQPEENGLEVAKDDEAKDEAPKQDDKADESKEARAGWKVLTSPKKRSISEEKPEEKPEGKEGEPVPPAAPTSDAAAAKKKNKPPTEGTSQTAPADATKSGPSTRASSRTVSVDEWKPDTHAGTDLTNGNPISLRGGGNDDAVEDWAKPKFNFPVPDAGEDDGREDEKKDPPLQQHTHEKHRTFVPLNIPFRRRLQTLAIFVHCSCLMFAIPFFLFICSNPLTWPLMVPYLLHVVYSTAAVDGRLKYRSKYFRSLPIWTWFAEYFPAQLHKTTYLAPTRKYIFGYHPHGIISHGAFVAFATEALGFSKKFPGITNVLLTLESNFKIPLYREYVLAAGMGSVSKNSIKNILSTGGMNGEGMGRAVTIVIGGARESLEAQPGTMKLILKERLGFVKMAIQTGADLVPVIGFGETDLYDQLNKEEHPWVHKFQLFVLRAMKFTLPFMRGRGVFNYDYGLMPYRKPLNIVVGKPIKVKAVKSGADGLDAEYVRKVHAEYVEELERLWETYKDEYLPERKGEMQLLV